MIASHGPMLRILTIHRLVQDRRYPNIPGLARLFGVSRRTVQRDLDLLRDEMGAPLAFHPVENGYEYTKEGFVLPDVEMTEGDLLSLLVASTALPAIAGTPGEPLLRSLLEKAAGALGEKRVISPETIGLGARPFTAGALAGRHIPAGVVSAIERAIVARETLRISTQSKDGAESGQQDVDPYHLASVDGEHYLIGYSHHARRVRALRIERLRAARPTGKHFAPPETSPEELLETTLPPRGTDRGFEAVLSIDPSLAGPVLARDWGPTARVQMRTDGGLELSFRSDNGDGVARWSFAWGPNAEVVSPPWVRRRTKQILHQIIRRYERKARRSRTAIRRERPPSRPPSDGPG